MKILQIGPTPPEIGGETTGGVATHLWGLSTHLAKRGHQVAILDGSFLNPPEIPVVKDGVRIYGLSKALILKQLPSILPNLPTIYRLKKHFKGLIGIRGIVMNFYYYDYVFHHFRPDVIHVHHLESRFAFAYFACNGKTPIVTTVHSFNTIKFLRPALADKYRELISKNIKLTSSLIFPSGFISQELDALFDDYFNGKRWIITNPIDVAQYHLISKEYARAKIGVLDEGPIILFVGNLVRKKGVYTIVEAVTILQDKGFKGRIFIVGDGLERRGLEDFISANSITHIVKLEGVKCFPELLYYYNAADLFVMPSLSEGWGYVFGEAMLCGTPVIGTDTPGIRDAIANEACSILIKPNDPGALAEAIEKGLNKKWDREKVIEFALSFSWEKSIRKFEKIYEGLIAKL
jgi:glycosyltransferase involved in cell wall biosynthesis